MQTHNTTLLVASSFLVEHVLGSSGRNEPEITSSECVLACVCVYVRVILNGNVVTKPSI